MVHPYLLSSCLPTVLSQQPPSHLLMSQGPVSLFPAAAVLHPDSQTVAQAEERDREEVSGIPLSPSASGWGAGGGGHWQQCEQGLGSLYSPVTFGEVSRGYPSLILAVTHSMSTGNLVGASCQLLT